MQPRDKIMGKINEKSSCILYNLGIKNNLFVCAYKLYPKYRKEEDMTDNGKPKYLSLMEQLRSDIKSERIREPEQVKEQIKAIIAGLIDKGERHKLCQDMPLIILMIGINGG